MPTRVHVTIADYHEEFFDRFDKNRSEAVRSAIDMYMLEEGCDPQEWIVSRGSDEDEEAYGDGCWSGD